MTFELTPGQYPFLLMRRLWVRLHPSVQVDDVSDAAEYPRDCVVRIDLSSLTELIFCRVSVDALLADGSKERYSKKSGAAMGIVAPPTSKKRAATAGGKTK